ncbi:hypothetical protein ACFP81_12515 [Deinococcus lacus]|uniref:Uncharacterized protein n=2 Tax=Deinococcus lacus TaxID=392561 RepID=A0ABW1YEJ9_9DEIO
MDDPQCDAWALERTYAQFEAVNRLVSFGGRCTCALSGLRCGATGPTHCWILAAAAAT